MRGDKRNREGGGKVGEGREWCVSVQLEEDKGKERTMAVATVSDMVYELNKNDGEHGTRQSTVVDYNCVNRVTSDKSRAAGFVD